MSRVFVSERTGATVYVFANDHCPPHVHARHRGEEWIARVSFSYLGDAVELMSIEPLKHAPAQRLINRLLSDVRAQLHACRRSWWDTQHTACLENQWLAVGADGAVAPVAERVPDAKQVIEAVYDVEARKLRIRFSDGTARRE